MGPVALILREQPSMRGAIEALIRYVPVHSDANHIALEEAGDLAILSLVLTYPSPGTCRQAAELGMAQQVRIFRQFLGERWRPLGMTFVHASPESLVSHHRVFGANVQFDQPSNALTFARADLDARNPNADPEMARVIRHYIDGLIGAAPMGISERVLELVTELLPTGHCSILLVSRQAGVDPRTLQRRLAEVGVSFHDVVQRARMGLASQYIEGGNLPLVEVADLLGFSALSAFSHWHRVNWGCSASERRRTAQARKMSTQ